MPDAYYCQWFSSLFSGNFFQLQEKELSPQETKCFRPLSRGLFSIRENSLKVEIYDVFSSPFSGTFFQEKRWKCTRRYMGKFSSPFSGTFFQELGKVTAEKPIKVSFRPLSRGLSFKACLRSPSPSALASAFAAGMRGSLHQALSFGDEMPIFPGRAGIGGDLQ